MKLYRKKYSAWEQNDRYVGRSGGYSVEIGETNKSPDDIFKRDGEKMWYFLLHKKEPQYDYNSLWDHQKFATKEQCVEAALAKIKDLKEKK